MTTALVLLLATAAAAVIRQLDANHRRATAWPTTDDATDRDVARARADLGAARTAASRGLTRPRALRHAAAGRHVAPPSVRAA